MFINHDYINGLLEKTKNPSEEIIQSILTAAKEQKGLSQEQIATLLNVDDRDLIQELLEIAGEIKNDIYGNRIVVFAPLYISNHCVNNCTYCGYRRDNKFCRRRLTQDEIRKQVEAMQSMGHKRLALETGEDPKNCDMEYILESIKTIYETQNKNGAIRRINVNIASTTKENYKRLKESGIGTYILFQETYHRPTFKDVHPTSIKGDYDYHLTSFDRAMEAGIDDVGGGVLFGLYDYKFEVLGLMLHNQHLEDRFGVGFHTISVPRLKKVEGVYLEDFPYVIDDFTFKKIVAIIRLAVPYTGMILSTRESAEIRKELLKLGISQISAGSCTDIGGYGLQERNQHVTQLSLEDHRSPIEVIKSLVADNYIPNYCTACYRMGRTGEAFMNLTKSEKIHNICTPNAILTLAEYILDYGDEELKETGFDFIDRQIDAMKNEGVKKFIRKSIVKMKHGERDLYL